MARVFYVDSINGSNANDGLTPSTAFADVFVDINSIGEEYAEFWIRSGSVCDIAETKSLYNTGLITWPESGDKHYDRRPSTDWDADVKTNAILRLTTNSADLKLEGTVSGATFSHIDFKWDGSTTGSSIVVSFGNLTFDDCEFIDPTFSIFYFDTTAGATAGLDFGNCVFNDCIAKAASVHFVDFNATYCSSNMSFTINRGKYNCNILFNQYANVSNIFEYSIFDSDITAAGIVRYQTTTTHLKTCMLTMKRNIISVGGSMVGPVNRTRANQYGVNFYFYIEDNTITAASYLFDIYMHGYTPGHNIYVYDCIIKNNTIPLCKGVFRAERTYFNSDSFHIYLSSANFVIVGNNIVMTDHLISFDGTYMRTVSGNYTIVDNTLSGQKSIINKNLATGSLISLTLVMKDTVVDGDLNPFSTTKGNLSLVNSTVSGSSGVYTEARVNVVNSSIGALNGSGVVMSAASSTFSGESLFPELKSGIFTNCKVSNIGTSIGQNGGKFIFSDCKVDNNFGNFISGNVGCYNTFVNGIKTPYFEVDSDFKKTISPVYRKDGSNGTLSYKADTSKTSSVSINNVGGNYEAGVSYIYMYMLAPGTMFDDAIYTNFSLIGISGGLKVSIPCTIENDTDSLWDGITERSPRFRFVADVSSANLDVGSVFNFSIYILADIGKPRDVKIDMKSQQV